MTTKAGRRPRTAPTITTSTTTTTPSSSPPPRQSSKAHQHHQQQGTSAVIMRKQLLTIACMCALISNHATTAYSLRQRLAEHRPHSLAPLAPADDTMTSHADIINDIAQLAYQAAMVRAIELYSDLVAAGSDANKGQERNNWISDLMYGGDKRNKGWWADFSPTCMMYTRL